jgi:UDP-N-acetylmuramate dehydrogenase
MTPQTDVSLAPLCTMGVGGAARHYVSAQTQSDVIDALQWAHARSLPVHVLGGGSNVIIADDGLEGVVIHMNIRCIEQGTSGHAMTFRVSAGEPWDPFVARAVDLHCGGVECLSGIPGSVGGTPVQNVGAYGQDVSAVITSVAAVDRMSGAPVIFSNRECAFGYRTSRFKHADANRYVVTSVAFELAVDVTPTVEYADVVSFFRAQGIAQPTLRDVREAVLAIRRRKGMVIEEGNAANRSCGSFFVNPVVSAHVHEKLSRDVAPDHVPHYVVDAETVKLPAAWLIERAGFPRGTKRGAVGVSPYQAQAIINLGNARAEDVISLAGDIKRAVWNMFRISIVPEPVFIGFESSPQVRDLLTHQRSD